MLLRFVFDQHVNARALKGLREDGVDVVHVADVGLSEADDAGILAWATQEDRIVVTRNYKDFAPLAQSYASRGVSFPGVLFYSSSVRHSDVGQHVRVLRDWIRKAQEAGTNPAQDGFGWLR